MQCVVLFVYSHQEAKDIVAGRIPPLLAVGNTVADHLAGEGAKMCRLPESVRSRVVQAEYQAHLVRMRILVSTLQTLEAEQALSLGAPRRARVRQPGPRPPAPKVLL